MVLAKPLPLPTPPVAVNDTWPLNPNGTTSISGPGVLTNDQANCSVPLVLTVITLPTKGSVVLNSNSFVYTTTTLPIDNDLFQYQVDCGGLTSTAWVRLSGPGALGFRGLSPMRVSSANIGKWHTHINLHTVCALTTVMHVLSR